MSLILWCQGSFALLQSFLNSQQNLTRISLLLKHPEFILRKKTRLAYNSSLGFHYHVKNSGRVVCICQPPSKKPQFQQEVISLWFQSQTFHFFRQVTHHHALALLPQVGDDEQQQQQSIDQAGAGRLCTRSWAAAQSAHRPKTSPTHAHSVAGWRDQSYGFLSYDLESVEKHLLSNIALLEKWGRSHAQIC